MTDFLPRVLIYKRTHRGDPDSRGIFGVNDCMGDFRNRHYDAVIGLGGIAPWPEDRDIACKVNWVGVGPKKYSAEGRGAQVRFEKFRLFDEVGPRIEELAPKLYRYMYVDANRRTIMSDSLSPELYQEVLGLLALVDGANERVTTTARPPKRSCR